MRVVTAAEMREIDRQAIESYGIPGIVLMENAGIGVVETVSRQLNKPIEGSKVTLFIGSGNNGGDGLVVARHLNNLGADVRVLMLTEPEKLKGDAATNLNIWLKMGKGIFSICKPNGIHLVKVAMKDTDVIIDAIYGTGFRGSINENVGKIIQVINSSRLPVIAIDVPSGVEADTGKVGQICVKAGVTVTFGLPKLGLIIEPGKEYVGDLVVKEISLPEKALKSLEIKRHLLDEEMIKTWLPKRPSKAHKGTFGRVMVVAGSKGMVGAAMLTAKACLRTGAGLVTLAVPKSIHSDVAGKIPEVMTLMLPDEAGSICLSALEAIKEGLKVADVLAIGPGLAQEAETVALINKLLPEVTIPMVVDADALNALSRDTSILPNISTALVLTPHPGEMARLCGIPVTELEENRVEIVQEKARQWGATVLLKGSRTLISNKGENLFINSTGNSGMATAGSGDVLTGIIAGLIAQKVKAELAAATGAFLHGMAGDMAKQNLGSHGLMAGDILQQVPFALKKLAEI